VLTPPTQHLHVIRRAREYGFSGSRWARAFAEADWAAAECLSDKPDRALWRVRLPLPAGPETLVVKVHALRSPLEVLRSMLHLGRLRRQWKGAARLSRRGFHAARGKALLRGRHGGAWCDVLVMEAVPGTPLLELIARGDLPIKTQHKIAHELGRLVSTLDAERLHSKDLKPSNIVVDDDDPGRLSIIDSDTVGRRPHHPLLPLVLEPLGVGVLPRRALLARVVRSWAWHEWLNAPFAVASDPDPETRYEREVARLAWREVARLVERHGDPTPRHDPLAHPPHDRPADPAALRTAPR